MKEHEAYEAALDTHKRFNPLEISESDFQIGWEAAIDYMMDRVTELESLLVEVDSIRRECYGDATTLHIKLTGNPFDEKFEALLPKEKQE